VSRRNELTDSLITHSLNNTISWKFDTPTIEIHYPTRSTHIRILNDYVRTIQLKCPLFEKLNKKPTNQLTDSINDVKHGRIDRKSD